VLFLREVHQVRGAREDEFEALVREGPALVFYATQAHGSGPSYRVVTLTPVADGEAWFELARRVQRGDLRDWAAELDQLRHDVDANLLRPLAWSPHETMAAEEPDHEPVLYMEDTMWPFPGKRAAYLEAAGTHYSALLQRPEALLDIRLATETAIGAGTRPEVCLLQRVRDPARVVTLLSTTIPPERRQPGTWMHDALALRDQWRSRLLRTSRWSPW
jgi:hypothetical protein